MPRDLSSVRAVARVQRLDGRSRVWRIYSDATTGWRRPARREPLTSETLQRLAGEGVTSVELRRGLHRGRVPLTWFHGVVPRRRGASIEPSATTPLPGRYVVVADAVVRARTSMRISR